jgi:hypothetical protein
MKISLLVLWSCFEAYDGFLYDWLDGLKSYPAVHECFMQKKTRIELKVALEAMMKEISQSTSFPNSQGFEVNDRLQKIVCQLK